MRAESLARPLHADDALSSRIAGVLPGPSEASLTGSLHKRQRTSTTPIALQATPGALTDDGLSEMGDTLCYGLQACRTAAADKNLSLEAECFSPNQTHHKVCSAIEHSWWKCGRQGPDPRGVPRSICSGATPCGGGRVRIREGARSCAG